MCKKKNKFKLYYLVLFALIQFPLRFNHYNYITYFFVYGIPLIYLFLHIGWTLNFIKRVFRTFAGFGGLIFIFLFLASCVWPLITASFEFSFVTEYWRRFFLLLLKNVFLVAFYENHIAKHNSNMEELIDYYLYAVILYICFTGLTLIFGELKSALLTLLYMTEKNLADAQDAAYATRFGWAGWSGFDITMQCTLGVVFCCILACLHRGRKNIRVQTKYLLIAGIILIGNMFYGRTGLTVSLMCLTITCVVLFLQGHIRLIFRVLLAILMASGMIFFLKSYIQVVEVWYNWAFSAFVNFLTNGRFRDNTGSLGALLDKMYWVPEWTTLLVGDGYYTLNGAYYMRTDSGIMRLMLFFGIINYLFGLLASYLVIYEFYRRAKRENLVQYGGGSVIIIILMIMIALFEIKGESFYKLVCIILPITFIRSNQYGVQETV